jgi:ABC-type glycerol-3-phosphate transport system substrate-binding protein
MKNVFKSTRIAIAATAVLLVGAGATISSAASAADQHGSTPATVTLAGPDQPGCIGCWD